MHSEAQSKDIDSIKNEMLSILHTILTHSQVNMWNVDKYLTFLSETTNLIAIRHNRLRFGKSKIKTSAEISEMLQ